MRKKGRKKLSEKGGGRANGMSESKRGETRRVKNERANESGRRGNGDGE